METQVVAATYKEKLFSSVASTEQSLSIQIEAFPLAPYKQKSSPTKRTDKEKEQKKKV